MSNDALDNKYHGIPIGSLLVFSSSIGLLSLAANTYVDVSLEDHSLSVLLNSAFTRAVVSSLQLRDVLPLIKVSIKVLYPSSDRELDQDKSVHRKIHNFRNGVRS